MKRAVEAFGIFLIAVLIPNFGVILHNSLRHNQLFSYDVLPSLPLGPQGLLFVFLQVAAIVVLAFVAAGVFLWDDPRGRFSLWFILSYGVAALYFLLERTISFFVYGPIVLPLGYGLLEWRFVLADPHLVLYILYMGIATTLLGWFIARFVLWEPPRVSDVVNERTDQAVNSGEDGSAEFSPVPVHI